MGVPLDGWITDYDKSSNTHCCVHKTDKRLVAFNFADMKKEDMKHRLKKKFSGPRRKKMKTESQRQTTLTQMECVRRTPPRASPPMAAPEEDTQHLVESHHEKAVDECAHLEPDLDEECDYEEEDHDEEDGMQETCHLKDDRNCD